ncbi:hypothetical protein TWF730_002325 [Orbilia blumenaviensis]|uniref:Uncharacterized protein n=1 Tax=Orbilia blumenaviensis TaxID=1796055 RepID=A0AAV9UE02_9PEZI
MVITCWVKPRFRHRVKIFERLDKELETGELSGLLLPPRIYSTHKVRSKHLGVWAYAMTLPMNPSEQSYRHITTLRMQIALKRFFLKGMRWMVSWGNPFDFCINSLVAGRGEAENWYNQPLEDKWIRWPEPNWWTEHWEEPIPGTSLSVTRYALGDLPLLSWPKDVYFESYDRRKDEREIEVSYLHDINPGRGTIVYILDNEFNFNHPVGVPVNSEETLMGSKLKLMV